VSSFCQLHELVSGNSPKYYRAISSVIFSIYEPHGSMTKGPLEQGLAAINATLTAVGANMTTVLIRRAEDADDSSPESLGVVFR
jgi:hypothetical protein